MQPLERDRRSSFSFRSWLIVLGLLVVGLWAAAKAQSHGSAAQSDTAADAAGRIQIVEPMPIDVLRNTGVAEPLRQT